jgi:hypothetical protein
MGLEMDGSEVVLFQHPAWSYLTLSGRWFRFGVLEIVSLDYVQCLGSLPEINQVMNLLDHQEF